MVLTKPQQITTSVTQTGIAWVKAITISLDQVSALIPRWLLLTTMFLLLMQTVFLLLPTSQFQRMISFAQKLARVPLLTGMVRLKHGNTHITLTVLVTSLAVVKTITVQRCNLVLIGPTLVRA